MARPLITVLAIAYNRREFIRTALLSAIHQTLPRDLYEIVLVTNFSVDPDILEAGKIRVILSDVRELGPKLASVVPQCQGEVISFLEDDDVWLPEKLEHVRNVFETFPRVSYYHNNWSVVDIEGNCISHPIHIQGRRKIISMRTYTIDKNASYADIRKAVHLTGDFNGSSISIKKSVVSGVINYLEQITFSPDSFLFYSALFAGGELYLDSETLTRYRIHPQNISRREAGASDALTDPTHFIILKMLRSRPGNEAALKSIECQMSDIGLESLWIWGFKNRQKGLKLALNHLKYISLSEFGYGFLLITFSLLYCLSPRTASSIYSQVYYRERSVSRRKID